MRGAGGHGGVSKLRVTVQPGQRIAKGEQLGMFHFGGSTTACCFAPVSSWRSTSTASSRGWRRPTWSDQHGAGAGQITQPPDSKGRLPGGLVKRIYAIP